MGPILHIERKLLEQWKETPVEIILSAGQKIYNSPVISIIQVQGILHISGIQDARATGYRDEGTSGPSGKLAVGVKEFTTNG